MNRQEALKILEEIPWSDLKYWTPRRPVRGMIALSEEQIEAVAFMLKVMRFEPDPEINSTEPPLARYDNGTCTQDNG